MTYATNIAGSPAHIARKHSHGRQKVHLLRVGGTSRHESDRIYARAYSPRTRLARAHALVPYCISTTTKVFQQSNFPHLQYGVYCISTRKKVRAVLHQGHTDEAACYIWHIQLYITKWTTSSKRAGGVQGSTSQRRKQPTSKVFLGDESNSIYIVTEFHASNELLRGPEIFIITS